MVVSSSLQYVKLSTKGTLYITVQYIYSAKQERKKSHTYARPFFLHKNPLKTTFTYFKAVRNR